MNVEQIIAEILSRFSVADVIAIGGLFVTFHNANVKRYNHLHDHLQRLEVKIAIIETRSDRRRGTDHQPADHDTNPTNGG